MLAEFGGILERARRQAQDTPALEPALRVQFPSSGGVLDGELIAADNLAAMRYLAARGDRYDVIYLDPPYDSDAIYHRQITVDGVPARQQAYADRFETTSDYLAMLLPRLIAAAELMAAHGVICVHVDQRTSAYVRVFCDELFGRNRLVNELIWRYGKMSNATRRFPQAHDTILVYAAGDDWHFRPVRVAPSEYRERFKRFLDGEQLRYGAVLNSTDKLIARRVRRRGEELGRELTNDDVLWDFDLERKVQDDVFTDISIVKGNAAENRKFDTQKPVALVARLLAAFCPEGGTVLDPFLGSGTTAAAARLAGGNWVGLDASPASIDTAVARLGDGFSLVLPSPLLDRSRDYLARNFVPRACWTVHPQASGEVVARAHLGTAPWPQDPILAVDATGAWAWVTAQTQVGPIS